MITLRWNHSKNRGKYRRNGHSPEEVHRTSGRTPICFGKHPADAFITRSDVMPKPIPPVASEAKESWRSTNPSFLRKRLYCSRNCFTYSALPTGNLPYNSNISLVRQPIVIEFLLGWREVLCSRSKSALSMIRKARPVYSSGRRGNQDVYHTLQSLRRIAFKVLTTQIQHVLRPN